MSRILVLGIGPLIKWNTPKPLTKSWKNLTYQATTELSRFIFDMGSIPYDDLQTIYGLVQCTRDTSLADCSLCLNRTISNIPRTSKMDMAVKLPWEVAV
uniref:Gnk2-homologous domain-containing protein n=1 Tax=Nymphaea colorata TaxID=210225 RepID=A0A5K0ZEK3_9MAGN